MTKSDYINKVNKVKYLANLYYNQNTSLVSDYEYDMLVKEIEEIERLHPEFVGDYSVSNRVGFEANSPLSKIPHSRPMISLDNVYSEEELTKILTNVNLTCTIEPKYDGLSLAVRYKNGMMVKAITRGDGRIGEDVTHTAMRISDIPKYINYQGLIEIRGEVLMSYAEFDRINKERVLANLPTFKNPRNLASGTLRSIDPTIMNERNLKFIAYDIVSEKGMSFVDSSQIISLLKSWKFITPDPQIINLHNMNSLLKHYENLCKSRTLPYDGAVIKVTSIPHRIRLGSTAKYPRWAVAFKYAPESNMTKLLKVTYEVGKTGRITPVAEFEPIELSGTTVSFATLHNMDYIKEKDIRIGDYINVFKAAEIIPYVESSVKTERTGEEQIIQAPTSCPACGGKVIKEDKYLKCTNEDCAGVKKAAIISFVSREGMNINGLGESIINKLFDSGYVKSPVHLYSLQDHVDDIADELNISKKVLNKIVTEIDASKENNLSKLLIGLSIPYVGSVIAKLLSKGFKSITSLFTASKDDLQQIPGIGEKVAESVVNYFSKQENKDKIEELIKHGVNTNHIDGNSRLEGLNVAITGGLETMGRKDLMEEIFESGGTISNNITNATQILIVGTKPTLRKVDLAKSRGIKMMTEEEFITSYMK